MAQNRGNIGQPGAGASAPIFDSLGISIPVGEIVTGTGTKAPGSSDSLLWNAGLFVTGPVRMEGLTSDALDSLAYFDADGDIGKVHVDDLGIVGGSGADSMGFVIPVGEFVFGTGTKEPGSSDSITWNAGLYVDALVNFSGLPNLTESAGDSILLINSSGNIFKSVLGPNFFTSNGTANGHRSHDFDGYNLTISDIANFTITSNGNWQFGTTASDIFVSGITGLGMGITTTGATNIINISSGNDIDLSATDDLVFDAPDIFLEDALTTDNSLTTLLVRDGSTGEIKARTASTLADSMGRTMPTGYLLMGQGNKLPDTSAMLFWDVTDQFLVAGPDITPSFPTLTSLYVNGTGTLVTIFESTDGGAVQLRLKSSVANNRRIIATDNSDNQLSQMELADDSYRFYGPTAATNPLNIFVAGTYTKRVGINTLTPAGALDITSTTGGFLPPRMTSTQRDALTAVAGMVIYNTTTSKLQVYTTSWTDLH